MNLLSLLQDQLDDNVIGKLAGLAGGSAGVTKTAIATILPKLMGGFTQKASSLSGAESLLGMIKDGGHDGSVMNNLSSVLSGGDATKNYLESGKQIVSSVFGNKVDSISDSVNTASALNKNANSTLMSALAPMLLGTLGGAVKSKGLDASGLQSLMSDQTSNFAAGTKSTVNKTVHASQERNSGGGGFLKWLLPLLLLLAAAWYFLRPSTSESTTVVNGTEQEASYTQEEKTAMKRNASNDVVYTLDANGNLVDANGNIISKAGEFTRSADGSIMDKAGKVISGAASISTGTKKVELDNDAPNLDQDVTTKDVGYYIDTKGNLVDEKGNVTFKAGSFTEKDGYYVDQNGNKLGRMLGKIGDMIKGAAEDVAGAVGKGAEAFAGAFTGLFSKKDKVGSTYTLQQIDFNAENHRIEKFSKDEVVALANSLKAYPDAKIQVQVHTNDGKDDGANKKLSSLRAKVVEDMLITLGVNKKQISAKGMGSENTAKATSGKVEIMVEK